MNRIVVFIIALMALPVFAEQSSKDQQIKDVVRNLLTKEEPELVAQAIDALRTKEHQKIAAKQQENLKTQTSVLYKQDGDPFYGDKDAPKIITLFQDYRCGHCKRAHPYVLEFVKNNKDTRIIFKEFPILGAVSFYAAKAAYAANKQGKYQGLSNAMMEADDLTKKKILSLAKAQGLNMKQLQKDIDDPAAEKRIKETFELASKLEIRGTPTFVAGEKIITGVLDQDQLKDLALNSKKDG
jgi:protein-disulfide isomerase